MGQYHRYAVEVFVRGTGLVRNLVTDPYSISLTTDSRRSFVADLDDRRLQPPGWRRPRRASPHRPTCRSTNCTCATFDQRHERALADRGTAPSGLGQLERHDPAFAGARRLTDVHLLPVFDIASAPEAAASRRPCRTPRPDSEAQQAAITPRATPTSSTGADPFHYTAPEGGYARPTRPTARRIVEFRQMVMALHQAGLRVGMDVVYNRTSASGRAGARSHRAGLHHRLDAGGTSTLDLLRETPPPRTAMMGKLMIDSVATWATQYHRLVPAST